MENESYIEMSNKVRESSKHYIEDQTNLEILNERNQCDMIKDKYVLACKNKNIEPINSLRKLTNYWITLKFGKDNSVEPDEEGISIFEQCALFDWDKSKKLKRKFEVIVLDR